MRKTTINRIFSSKQFFLALFLFQRTVVFSQTDSTYVITQRIIPPSPEAVSLGTVGFSNVNLYTGKASYSLPIYTINQSGISFPITLSYTGGGGIKVEEISSSVGLGWNLSSSGVISRVIRGLADDEYTSSGGYTGYMNLPDFPPKIDSNYSIYQLYAKNKYDGQPDLYSLSVAGLSAQFYITKDKKVLFIEKSDLQITPVISGFSIVAFEVKDLNGTKYYFSDLEKTKTIYLDGSFADYSPYNTTSWYLTKIISPYGKDILTFTYLSGESNQSLVELRSPYQFSRTQNFQSGDNTTWSEQFYKRPLLQKINFPAGEIDFKVSDSSRYDIGSTDHALESLVVKNYLGDTVKQFHFDYSYFTSTGVIQQGQSSPSTYGNSALRLKLDSLEDISRSNQKLTYKFVYDTTHYLPDRLGSFAMDHWGFFNGQTSNTVWEAKNRVKYYNVGDSIYAEYGTANREPSLEYAKAGVLTKVITPTKGEIRFNYELNSSSDTRLPNTMTIADTWYYPTSTFSTNYFSINLINQPFDTIKIQSDVTSSSYSYEYLIEDSLQTQIFYHDTLVVGDAQQKYMLLPGHYCIIQKVLGSNPDTSYHYFTRLFKEEETYLPNKPVGGIRIRSMQLYDPVKGTTLQRNYYYNESGDTSATSLSTGTISNAPQYGHQNIDYFYPAGVPGTITLGWWQDDGYTREVSSFYPLGVTAGSFVGYKKVTVVDSNALKTESYFTSFTDFPELADGYSDNPLDDLDGSLVFGKWYEQNPIAPTDERDFLRGKLTRQVIYKKENGVFSKIQQTENSYQFNMGFAVNDHDIRLPDTMERLVGMVFLIWPRYEGDGDIEYIDFKNYSLYTTRYDLKKTVEKQYTYQGGMDSLVMETNYEYGDSPWYRDSLYHYQPTKISKIVNTGTKLTRLYYPYDWRYGIPDTLSGETNNFKILDTSNRIAAPVLQVITDSTSGLNISSVKNTYSPLVNSILAPNLVKTKQGSSTSFENRVSFNKYDTSGNLIEQQKTNDIKSVYIWDYKNSYPVAEVINADSASVAYTSFEAENKGGWSYSGTALDTVSVTGKKAYKLNGSNGLSKSGLNSSNVYILSYWTRNGSAFSVTGTQSGYPISGRSVNGWTYYEHKITGQTSVSLSGTGWVDEVRLYPASAQMSSITYTPLLGISSQCDANNRIAYYEYDGFGRLSIVRDQDKNIVKRIRYNYAGQTETANYYYNASASQSFTRNNCGTGYTGSSVTYTVAAGVYGSDISQADADKKAAADIAANGQNYANANGTCTYVCDSTTCSGVNKKCINNNCETGVKVYTDTYYDSGLHKWVCTYHYEWSDGSWSGNYVEYSNFACPI